MRRREAVTTEYDNHGNVRKVTDRLGRVTTFDYDRRNRLVSTTNAEDGVVRFEYDVDNNMTAMTDENGNRTSYAWDARNRLDSDLRMRTAESPGTTTTLSTICDRSAMNSDESHVSTMTMPTGW